MSVKSKEKNLCSVFFFNYIPFSTQFFEPIKIKRFLPDKKDRIIQLIYKQWCWNEAFPQSSVCCVLSRVHRQYLKAKPTQIIKLIWTKNQIILVAFGISWPLQHSHHPSSREMRCKNTYMCPFSTMHVRKHMSK